MNSDFYMIQTSKKSKYLSINKQNLQTLKDLKLQISKQLPIDLSKLRLLKNNREIKEQDSISLKDLNLLETDQIKVVSNAQSVIHSSQKSQEKQIRQLPPLNQHSQMQQDIRSKSLEQKIKQTTDKLIKRGIIQPQKWSTLSQGNEQLAIAMKNNNAENLSAIIKQFKIQWIKRLIPKIIKNKQFQSKISLFTSKNGLLQYVFQQIAQIIPSFEILLQNQYKMLFELTKQMFYSKEIDQDIKNQIVYEQNLSKLASKELISLLSRFTSRENAQQIVQMTQNDLHSAIEVAEKGPIILQSHRLFKMSLFQKNKINDLKQWQQQPFIFRWITSSNNIILRLQLQMDRQYLKLYLLSMKHINPPFFTILLRHREYVLKIIEIQPPALTCTSTIKKIK